MPKRPITPTYIVFYILFLPDSWQILMGIIFALILHRFAVGPDMSNISKALVFIMLATIGYTITRIPARWITQKLKTWILGQGKR
ncbi:MAG: hypothetical protein KGY61_10285 [Desulfobacterales bacterium]|nr:hypothetical protein [Desulfobacterales bacterium]